MTRDEEPEDFPRGGEGVHDKSERPLKEFSRSENLFGSSDASKNIGIKGKKKRKNEKQQLDSKLSSQTIKTKKTTLENFSFKYLKKGFLLLGYVKEINRSDVVVGLANSLNGFISLTSITTHINQYSNNNDSDIEMDDNEDESQNSLTASTLFKVGQIVPVVVINLFSGKHGFKKIELSPFPSNLNITISQSAIKEGMLMWGAVKSNEDHGYVISLGKDDVQGFMKKSKGKDDLTVGQLMWFYVKKVEANRKIITLSDNTEKLQKSQVKDSRVNFNSLLPGQLVKFTCSDVSDKGVTGKVFDSFDGIVDSIHLPEKYKDENNVNKKKIPARIIHINPSTKQIGLSCLQNIISFPNDIISHDYEIGEIIKDAVVTSVDNNNGLDIQMADGNNIGHVHVSRVCDGHIDKISGSKKYKTGSKHMCRVLGYSGLDETYTLTMQQSDIEKKFLRHDDLKPGMVVSGTVITLEKFGCLIKITDHIRGLLPRLHLADINLKHPEKKFVEGKMVKCRVLSVVPDMQQLVLTHKKTLVSSDLPLITSYDDAKVGSLVHGFISGIKSYGLFVMFYNNVKALLPKSEIKLQPGATFESTYYVGQVIQCYISSMKKGKLTVSFKASVATQNGAGVIGKVVKSKFIEMIEKESVSVKAKDGTLEGSMSLTHISDFNALNKQWLVVLSEKGEYVFEDLMVIGVDKDKGKNILSGKHIHDRSDNRLKTFEDLKVNQIYGGFVTHIMSYGIFIELARGITGLVPVSKLADQYITDADQFFHIGQSIIVKITDIDTAKRRFLGTTKPSVITGENEDVLNQRFCDVALLETYLSQRKSLHDNAKLSTDVSLKHLPQYIGEVLIVKVTEVNKTEVVVTYVEPTDGTTVNGIIPAALKQGVDCELQSEMQLFVIDVDLEKKIFIATAHPDIIKSVVSKKGKKQKFKVDTKVEAIINLVNDDMIMLTVLDKVNRVVYMPARKHLNDITDPRKKYAVNQKVSVVYQRETENGILVKDIDEHSTDSKNLKVGSTVTVTIKTVKPTQLSVTLLNGRSHGRIHVSEILDNIVENESPLEQFKVSQTVQAKILGFRDFKSHNYLPISHTNVSKSLIELSLKPSTIASDVNDLPKEKSQKDYKNGEAVQCYITSLTKTFAYVATTQSVKGRIFYLHLSTNVKDIEKWQKKYKPGNAYNATVVGYNSEYDCVELSCIGDPVKVISKSSNIVGKITKIIPNVGLLIQIPNQTCGIAHVTELNTEFKENPLAKYNVNDNVSCHVLSVKRDGKINLSLRESRLNDMIGADDVDRCIDSYDDIKEGDILRGYIKSCSKMGAFVSLSPDIIGRVQIKNLSQYFVKDFQNLFPIGKLVKAKVLSINPVNQFIDLSLRGKDVNDKDPAPPPKRTLDESDVNSDEEVVKKKQKILDITDAHNELNDSNDNTDSDGDSSDDESDSDNDKVTEVGENEDVKPGLKISGDFNWTDDTIADELGEQSNESDSEDDESKTKSQTKKTKRQKRAAKKAEEENLHKAELALLDTERQMESGEDFDRLVLGSPNSSIIWIQYMAFHLHLAEIEKAKAVAERALKTISFREEQEKFNVWVALLNLESMYGTEESLEKRVQEAIKVNEMKKVYMKLVDIYIKNGKNEAAEKLYQEMLKKNSTKTSKAVWIGYGYFLSKQGEYDKARKLLQQSLKSLPQRKHIETIIQFAIMEYKIGESQRGSTVFESVLKNYPKRTDVWSIYIDMTIKTKDFEQVRNIFERASTLNLSAKKMKFLYKRYLDFETQNGTPATVAAVRRKAQEYVESQMEVDNDDE